MQACIESNGPRTRADETMARVTKMEHYKFSLASGEHFFPNFFISFVLPASLYCEEYVFICTPLTAYRLYMNYRC